jgi:hypothetical protein
MKNELIAAAFAVAAAVAGALGAHTGAGAGASARETGMVLEVDADGEADVDRLLFSVRRAGCDGEDVPRLAVTIERDIDAADVKSRRGGRAENAFAAGGADAFLPLPPGCYDVGVAPLREDGAPSAECARGSFDRVPVSAGGATEAIVLLKCARGAGERAARTGPLAAGVAAR